MMETAKEILKKNITGYRGSIKQSDAINAMIEYADQFKAKWISVEDGFPLHNAWYNVRKKNGSILSMYFHIDNKFYFNGMSENSQVTHWTILPDFD